MDNVRKFKCAMGVVPASVRALLLQIIAIASTLLLIKLIGFYGVVLSSIFCGILAASLSYAFRQNTWWLPIQLLFAPALITLLSMEISPVFFGMTFLVLLLTSWGALQSVPLYLSSKKTWRALEELLPANTGNGFTFVDLGSGFGGALAHLAKARPDGEYTGVEIAPLPCAWSWLRTKLSGRSNCHIHYGSLWGCNLAQYDVIFAFLSPIPMEKLWQKANAEMRPGTLFISNTFIVPNQTPYKVVQVDDLHGSTLMAYRIT